MTKEKKNFVYMWLPVAAFILGSLAVKYDIYSLFIVIGIYAFCLLITAVKVKTVTPKEAGKRISRRIKVLQEKEHCGAIVDITIGGRDA